MPLCTLVVVFEILLKQKKNSLEKLHVEFDMFEIVWEKIILDGVSENYMNKHQK